MSDQECRRLLEKQVSALKLQLEPSTIDQLMAYHAMLVKWNKAYNLTAVRDPIEMINRHIVDSLSVIPHILIKNPKTLVDVGSGPGLPGVMLAICLPDLAVTTIDSNGKKTRFQQQVKIELGLANLDVQNIRAEQCQAPAFDIVISRAFASLQDMVKWTAHLCAPQGVFLAMKGQPNPQELSQLPSGYALIANHELIVPGAQGSRHLMEIGRA